MKLSLLCATALSMLPAVFAGNWTVSPYSQTIMMDINMVSPLVGFIAGAQNGEGSNIIQTKDGGNTWTELNAAPTSMMLMAAAASSETSAIAAGVSILSGSTQYTTDGINFFNSSEPHVLVEAVTWASTIGGTDGAGYAVIGDWVIANESAQVGGVGVSFDSGKSFSIIDINNENPARYGAFPTPDTWFVTYGTFPNTSSTGRAISRNIHIHTHGLTGVSLSAKKPHHRHHQRKSAPPTPSPWLAQIMRTSDGGQTWDLLFNDDTFYFNQIACPTTGVCFAVGENDSEAFVYRSMDGGETWSNVLPSQYASGLSLMAVEALSETEVYVGGGVFGSFGVTGSVLYSSDSGTTWTLESIPNNYINALSFPTSENGAATSINTDQQSGILIYTA